MLQMKFLLLLQKRERKDPADEEAEEDDQDPAEDPDGVPILGQELAQEGSRGAQGGEEDAETQNEEKRVNQNDPAELLLGMLVGQLFKGEPGDKDHVRGDQGEDAGGKERQQPAAKAINKEGSWAPLIGARLLSFRTGSAAG